MDSAIVKTQVQNVERLEQFNGLNYKHWSLKIFYQLTIAKVAYVLSTAYPHNQSGESISELNNGQKKWLEDDYICQFTILQAMTNSLFNVFHKHSTAYELWAAIQRRYVNEDAGNKSFLVNKYVEFKMVDSKPIIDQVNELNDIATECADAGESISETFQVSTLIGKLPSSWKDYQKRLKHERKYLNLDKLVQHIQIENKARNREISVDQGKKDKVLNVDQQINHQQIFLNP
ncbi:uncharacterized protein LOC143861593 [Tasmannia lanceolata]|uniref:uncharacterized protein LOC143861593 n=1 Tax=Tasmannia lanceolata TaxID=3420 RepID=UPI0040647943